MPAIIDRQWYNANEMRSYPLSDQASGISDSGIQLPYDLLVDANIWFPRRYGKYLYVSSATISSGLVSLTFLATDYWPYEVVASSSSSAVPSSSSSSSVVPATFVPIAAVSVVRPVTKYRNYAVTPYQEGVAGWVAFGEAVDEHSDMALLFSNPEATVLATRIARAYGANFPVKSLARENAIARLTGFVKLSGGNDVVVEGGDRCVGGTDRRCIIVRLNTDQEDRTAAEVLRDYAGPCGNRPDSNNCKRTPFEMINDFVPIDGNINITFPPQFVVSAIAGGGGMILDYTVGLSETCETNQFLPDDGGRLPFEAEDICEEEEAPSSSSSVSP